MCVLPVDTGDGHLSSRNPPSERIPHLARHCQAWHNILVLPGRFCLCGGHAESNKSTETAATKVRSRTVNPGTRKSHFPLSAVHCTSVHSFSSLSRPSLSSKSSLCGSVLESAKIFSAILLVLCWAGSLHFLVSSYWLSE